jgi:zinc protease
LDDVRALHKRLVTTDKLVFAFAGDITQEAAEASVERMTRGLPEAGSPAIEAPPPQGPKGRKLVLVDKPDRTQTQILIGGMGTHPKDGDHVALLVANTIFGGTFTARLTQEVRAKRGWSYGAYSSLPFDLQRRTFSMWTFPKAEDAAACVKLQLDLLQQWRDDGVTKKELSWAKRYLRRSDAFSRDTAAKRVGLKLDSVTYDLPHGYYENMSDLISAVSLEQVNDAVKNRIFPEDLLFVVVGTSDPIREPLKEAIGQLEADETVPFDELE